jgi:hypothetical protein
MPFTAEDAIEALRKMERLLPQHFTLEPGLSDAELTAQDPSLPDDIRAILRVTTGIRTRYEYHGSMEDVIALDPKRTETCSEWVWGPGETARVILELGTGDTFFVDRNPVTGAWGAVFSQSADYFETWLYCASSLPQFLVRYAEEALENAEAGEEGFDVCFPFETMWDLPEKLRGTPVSELKGTDDPDLAEVVASLPEDAILADLRSVEPPVMMDMEYEGDFQRHGAERLFAVAYPD